MIIDFTSTGEQHGTVYYYNIRGNNVRQYPLAKLEEWVIKQGLNLHTESANGCIGSDPNIIEEEVETDITDYLDLNWRSVTEDFYNAMNPTEFKSQNTPNQKHV